MLATLIIVFREVIEAGLIIGIVMSATRGVRGRGGWVSLGIAAGVVGACLVAAFADSIANMVAGAGQEIFNASVMAIAVVMLGGHNIWMAREGRQLGQDMQSLGADVAGGSRSLAAMAVVVGVAVLREGSEIALFLYGIALSEGSSALTMFLGGAIGVALGGAVSAAMYFGLLRIPTRHVFTVTSRLIALLAAGMAAQATVFLQQAGLVNVYSRVVWDTSGILSEGSLTGKALHSLIGYSDRPTGIQLIVYVATLVIIFTLMRLFGHPPQIQKPSLAASGTHDTGTAPLVSALD
jgi:high-affinity iron transporter